MAYPFENETIVQITYTNPERDTIEITWDPNDGIPNNFLTFHGEASDAGLQKWLLANGYTDEVIYENTRDKNAVDQKNFHQMVNAYAKPFIDKMAAEYEIAYQKVAADYEAAYRNADAEMEKWKETISDDYKERYDEYRKAVEKELQQKIETLESKELTAMREYRPDPEYMDYLKKKQDYKNIADSTIINVLISCNKDEEAIFKAKLAIFQLPELKDNKDKNIKTKIRKSNSMLELVKVLGELEIL